MDRKNNFDFLRLAAAIGVLLSHCYLLLDYPATNDFYKFLNPALGDFCVYVFFIISGYLITKSYVSSPKRYATGRFLRIFPALFINVVLTSFILGSLLTSLPLATYFANKLTYDYILGSSTIILFLNLPGVFQNNSFSYVNGSLWTLGAEVFMYFAIWFVGKIKLKLSLGIIGLLAICAILMFSGYNYPLMMGDDLIIHRYPNLQLAVYFLIGALFYLFRDYINYRSDLFILLITISFLAWVLGFSILATYIFLPYAVFHFAFSETIQFRNAARYGDFSYGIYIYAYPVQQALIALNKGISPLMLFLQASIITLILAAASWHLVEKHALKLKIRKAGYE